MGMTRRREEKREKAPKIPKKHRQIVGKGVAIPISFVV